MRPLEGVLAYAGERAEGQGAVLAEAGLAASEAFAADVTGLVCWVVVFVEVVVAGVAALGGAVAPLADVVDGLALGGADAGKIQDADHFKLDEFAGLTGFAVHEVDLFGEGGGGVGGAEGVCVALEVRGVEEAGQGADTDHAGAGQVGAVGERSEFEEDGRDGSVDVGDADFGAGHGAVAGVLEALGLDGPGVVGVAGPDDVARDLFGVDASVEAVDLADAMDAGAGRDLVQLDD